MSKLNTTDKKMLIASTIGSIFEVFDFLSFVFLSSIIADLYFPKENHSLALIFTYLTITISYLLRPIGGLILGHLGDKYGRKSVFTLSILLMSVPSFLIGILPTYSQIGISATILLLIARISQGFSLGGEVPGSITYIAEKLKNKNFYFYVAFLTFGANVGVATGSFLIRLLNNYTSHEFMYSYGFRIPFLIGGLLTIVGFYIRQSVTESDEFKELQKAKQLESAPLVILIKGYGKQIISGIFLCIIVSMTTSVFHVFLPNLFITFYKFDLSTASNITAIGAITMAVFSLIFAYLSKYIKVISIIRYGLLSLGLIMVLILTHVFDINRMLSSNVMGLYFLVMAISIAISMVNGLFFGVLATLFPTQIRFSGISFCYNIAYIIGAGLTPLWTSSVLQLTGNYNIIIGVMLALTILSFINTYFLQRVSSKEIR